MRTTVLLALGMLSLPVMATIEEADRTRDTEQTRFEKAADHERFVRKIRNCLQLDRELRESKGFKPGFRERAIANAYLVNDCPRVLSSIFDKEPSIINSSIRKRSAQIILNKTARSETEEALLSNKPID